MPDPLLPPSAPGYSDGPPTTPRALSPEARDVLILQALEELVSKAGERSYLRSFAESKVGDRIRIDHLAFLVALASIAAGLGVSLPDVWRVVTGAP